MKMQEFLRQHDIKVLNVAGPRQSEEPAVAAFVIATLKQWHVNFGL
jgi:hypothetical protein